MSVVMAEAVTQLDKSPQGGAAGSLIQGMQEVEEDNMKQAGAEAGGSRVETGGPSPSVDHRDPSCP